LAFLFLIGFPSRSSSAAYFIFLSYSLGFEFLEEQKIQNIPDPKNKTQLIVILAVRLVWLGSALTCINDRQAY
jgi:hypothetical protein